MHLKQIMRLPAELACSPNTRAVKAGPKFKAQYDRFPFAPCGVYVIEYGNCIKVGRANAPRERFQGLHRQAVREGVTLGRFTVFPVDSLLDAERVCLRAMRRVSTPLKARGEYFRDIEFDAAVGLVRSVLDQQSSPKSGQP